eukprot:Sdes_comp20560_c0_seq3m15381
MTSVQNIRGALSLWLRTRCVLGVGNTKVSDMYEKFLKENTTENNSFHLDYELFVMLLEEIPSLASLKVKKTYSLSIVNDQLPQLLPYIGSEDHHLTLDSPLMLSSRNLPDGSYEFSKVEWVVDVSFPKRRQVMESDIIEAYGEMIVDFLAPVILYGRSEVAGLWRRLDLEDEGIDCAEDEENANFQVDEECENSCEVFQQICLAVTLVSDARQNESQSEILAEKDLKFFLKKVKSISQSLGSTSISSRTSPREGANRAIELAEIVPDCEQDISLLLVPSEKSQLFDYICAWDSLVSLGLEYDNELNEFVFKGSVFHATNPSSSSTSSCESFHDRLFSVSLHINDGTRFSPDRVFSETQCVAQIRYSFYLPYTPEPEKIFALVVSAILYTQNRLVKSEIRSDDGELLKQSSSKISNPNQNRDFTRQGDQLLAMFRDYHHRIKNALEKMQQTGIQPGEDLAYMVW